MRTVSAAKENPAAVETARGEVVNEGESSYRSASGSISLSQRRAGVTSRLCRKESPAIAVTAMRGEVAQR